MYSLYSLYPLYPLYPLFPLYSLYSLYSLCPAQVLSVRPGVQCVAGRHAAPVAWDVLCFGHWVLGVAPHAASGQGSQVHHRRICCQRIRSVLERTTVHLVRTEVHYRTLVDVQYCIAQLLLPKYAAIHSLLQPLVHILQTLYHPPG